MAIKKKNHAECRIFLGVFLKTQLFKIFSFDLSRTFEGKVNKTKLLVLFKYVFNALVWILLPQTKINNFCFS